MKTVAVIPAAGEGVRMGTGLAKQFMEMGGKPLLALTLDNIERCSAVESVFLVVPANRVMYCRKEIVDRYGLKKVREIVPGGKRRQDSVRLGLEAAQGDIDFVLIHDGVRPFIHPEFIAHIIRTALKYGAVIPVLPLKETVKEVGEDGRVVRSIERGSLRLVQTPQVFRYEDILSAHRRAAYENWQEMTDDARLMERMGIPITVVEGLEENIKITTPYDLELARFILRREQLHYESTEIMCKR
ncbi:MAG: 2-C-methyl-D-erythritol 4-phosphate cytidylyltransferase [Deltaproteobacteria bacterium]|nr:2-C-methyl-D-erythritol 4-phosphate cytidylyltransferase [Deltaproteobacteria bacterium]